MLFSDWDDIIGYGRVWGVSRALKWELDGGSAEICFFDMRSAAVGSVLAQPQRVWVEAVPKRMVLAKDFDGIIWVRHVHPPQMPLLGLLAWCSPRYRGWLSVLILGFILAAVCAIWIAAVIVRRRRTARAFAG